MKFPNFDKIWTAEKNFALPDILSLNTPSEILIRKTKVEIPQNTKLFLTKNETPPHLESKYAVKIYLENVQRNKLQYFTISRLPKQPLRSRFFRKFFIQANTILIKGKETQSKTKKKQKSV